MTANENCNRLSRPLVSIIIPVYNNTDSEIKRCLETLRPAVSCDVEIIVIDDGSGQACGGFLDSMGHHMPWVRVIHQKHAGVSMARNYGVSIAHGVYVLFVDADDMVTPALWEDLPRLHLEKPVYDIIYGLAQKEENNSGNDSEVPHQTDIHPVGGRTYKKLYRHMVDAGDPMFCTKMGTIVQGPVARFVKRSFFLKHLFDKELVHGEDIIWNLDMLRDEAKVGIVYHMWYIYTRNPASITHKPNPNYAKWQKKLLLALVPYSDEEWLRPALEHRIFVSLRVIADCMYLTPANRAGLLQKAKEFSQMMREYPYTTISYKYTWGGKALY